MTWREQRSRRWKASRKGVAFRKVCFGMKHSLGSFRGWHTLAGWHTLIDQASSRWSAPCAFVFRKAWVNLRFALRFTAPLIPPCWPTALPRNSEKPKATRGLSSNFQLSTVPSSPPNLPTFQRSSVPTRSFFPQPLNLPTFKRSTDSSRGVPAFSVGKTRSFLFPQTRSAVYIHCHSFWEG
jgi:hypothetical protein